MTEKQFCAPFGIMSVKITMTFQVAKTNARDQILWGLSSLNLQSSVQMILTQEERRKLDVSKLQWCVWIDSDVSD